MRIVHGFTVATAILLAMPAVAQDKPAQAQAEKVAPAHIAKMLDELKLKYEIDDDKDYSVVFNYTDEKRSQLVFVESASETVDGFVIRSIFAPTADVGKNPLSTKDNLALLTEAGKLKWGQWEVRGKFLYFTIKMIEPFTAKQLESALKFAAEVADNKEIELSGKTDAY
jgi:hypothetical protein